MRSGFTRRGMLARIGAASTAVAVGVNVSTVAAITQDESPKSKRKSIVCSTTQVADFARNVVGDRWNVIGILGAGADPHTYQRKASDPKLVADSTLCLENGWHLEGKEWMQKLAKDSSKPIVTCVSGVKQIPLEEEGGGSVNDPHAWFDPKNAWQYVKNITEAVIKLDPDHKDEYIGRARLYSSQLKALDGWIRETVNVIPEGRRVLITHHDAFGYFCKAYNFKAESPVGWSTAEMAGMTLEKKNEIINKIKDLNVKSIFVETSTSDETLKDIAKEAGIKIGGYLYSDAMGPANTAGETYLGMMRENVLTIVEALK